VRSGGGIGLLVFMCHKMLVSRLCFALLLVIWKIL
jgi:hypothetical protein